MNSTNLVNCDKIKNGMVRELATDVLPYVVLEFAFPLLGSNGNISLPQCLW